MYALNALNPNTAGQNADPRGENTARLGRDYNPASNVPTLQQTSAGLVPASEVSSASRDFARNNATRIYHPRQAPSAITAENYLEARALMTKVFLHNKAATKSAIISNMYKDAPRFRDQLDILV